MRLASLLGASMFAAALFAAKVAAAHDHWLEAEPFHATTAGREKVYLFVGDAFEGAQPVVVKNREQYARFFVSSVAGKRDILGDLHEDTTPIALLTSGKTTGSFVISLDSAPRTLELDAKKFSAYLLEERLLDVLQQRMQAGREDDPGRERYSRCLKAFVQIGTKLDPTPTQPQGQELEIVPDANPYTVAVGGALGVRVLFKGKPLPSRAISAVNRYRGEITRKTVRLDANGHAAFTLPKAGDWMLRVVHMEPSAQGDVDWRSYWSNVTFSLPDTGAAPPAG